MELGLWQEQAQKMILTPELRQAITILQFSTQELLEYLEEEAASNAVLEWEPLPSSMGSKKEFPLESVVRSTVSLEDYLLSQLVRARIGAEEKKVIQYLIGNIDERGYLAVELADAATACRQPVDVVEHCLQLIQSLDPPGIGARNLKECLVTQARLLVPDEPDVVEVIEHYLEDLAAGRIARIAQQMKRSTVEVQRIADIIRRFEPRPGGMFFQEPPKFIIPDVTIERVGDDLIVVVNESLLPRLTISPLYRSIAAKAAAGGERHDKTNAKTEQDLQEAREYIESKIHSAVWLLKGLEQRKQTIRKVTEAIVRLQRAFFDSGVEAMKPLTLKQVAEQVGLHESTVSRATSNKYAQTPRGVFELKYFFTSGVHTAHGETTSSESVKRVIKDLIAQEDPKRPLSDQQLTDMLQERGIQIKRRTVAKYREDMMIPTSAQRRRY